MSYDKFVYNKTVCLVYLFEVKKKSNFNDLNQFN